MDDQNKKINGSQAWERTIQMLSNGLCLILGCVFENISGKRTFVRL